MALRLSREAEQNLKPGVERWCPGLAITIAKTAHLCRHRLPQDECLERTKLAYLGDVTPIARSS